MPVVNISITQLRRLVGRDLGREELIRTLEELGSDVEGRAVVVSYRCGVCGQATEVLEHEDFNQKCSWCGSTDLTLSGSTEVIRINLLPVRPDMFDVCGLARAMRGYLGIETGLARWEMQSSGFSVSVRPGLENIRPYIVACVVRNLPGGDETVRMLMKMQENLHWALGRDRRRASIGVYDLDKVTPGFVYRPVGPQELKFVPLFGMPEGMVAVTPEEILARHPKGIGYKHLLAGYAQYPLLCDSQGQVLSLPPIINSETTRVTPETRNLFIDVTGPDRNAIVRTLAVMAASLSELGGKVETVEVVYPDGNREVSPDFTPTEMKVHPETVRQVLGFEVTGLDDCLARMRYGIAEGDQSAESADAASVLVPAYRADIMHEYDIIEDVGIAYGYQRIIPRLVSTFTVGRPLPIEELAETCRRIMTGLGYLEIMTLSLTNEREHFDMLQANEAAPLECLRPQVGYCQLENPASTEQTILRTHLLSGLLATFRVNVTREMPQAVFEVGECFVPDQKAETGVRSRRKLAAGICGPRAGFVDVRQLADTLLRELDLAGSFEPYEHPTFISGRCARVYFRRAGKNLEWGLLGEVHPEVLMRFGLGQPVALLEIELDQLL